MAAPSKFLIAGGTGRQGGAVVAALLADNTTPTSPQDIYVLTRNSSGSAAQRLSKQGIHLVVGELGQPAAVFKQLSDNGVKSETLGVFLAQAHGPTELGDAKGFIDAAVKAGVAYFVYSSVDRGGEELSDRDASYCKTFSDKFQIEKYLIAASTQARKSTSCMQYTILRPVWFADNADWGFPGKLCMTGWRDRMKGKRLQVITTKDIGRWAVEALLRPDKAGIRNRPLSIASDELTFEELDRIYREVTGQAVGTTYWWLAGVMIWAIKDVRTMFSWIDERNYGADLQRLRQTVEPTTFRAWVEDGRH